MALSTAARAAALTAWLSLGCWRGPALGPQLPVAVVPFDAYGGAIYVPGVIDGDSAWLMLDTGLSRPGLDRAWAATAGLATADTASTAVVKSLRLGDLALQHYRSGLYRPWGLGQASARPP